MSSTTSVECAGVLQRPRDGFVVQDGLQASAVRPFEFVELIVPDVETGRRPAHEALGGERAAGAVEHRSFHVVVEFYGGAAIDRLPLPQDEQDVTVRPRFGGRLR